MHQSNFALLAAEPSTGLIIGLAVFVAIFVARMMGGKKHGPHGMGCAWGTVGLIVLCAIGFGLFGLSYVAVRPHVHYGHPGGMAHPPVAVPRMGHEGIAVRSGRLHGPLGSVNVTLNADAIRKHEVTADEIADSLLGLVDFVRTSQRGFVDFAAGARPEGPEFANARRMEPALLVGIRVHEEVTLNDIARVTVTRPLGAPDALLGALTINGSGGQGDFGVILSKTNQRFVEANSHRTDYALYESRFFHQTLSIDFDPIAAPAPPRPTAEMPDPFATPAPVAVNAPTAEDSADAPSAAAEVATAVAATVAKTVKETLNTNDADAQESVDSGAVAKRVAAHVVAALLNATLSDKTEKNESDTTTVEAAAADNKIAVEGPPANASAPATPPIPAAPIPVDATAASPPLPPEPPANLIPVGREPANDQERAALRERLDAAAETWRDAAKTAAETVKSSEKNEELKAKAEAQRKIADVRKANREAQKDAREAAQRRAQSVAQRLVESRGPARPNPINLPTIETKRPAWLDAPQVQQVNDQGVFRLVGSTGALYSTPQDAGEAAPDVERTLTRQYAALILGEAAAARLEIDDLLLRVAKTSLWTERVHSPVSELPLYETHVLVEFNDDARRAIEERWRLGQTNHRLIYAGTLSGVVLGLIGTLFGYLKLDTATRGYYSGRLKLAAGTFVSLLVAAALFVLRGGFSM